MTKSIREKRLDALYDYSRMTSKTNELLQLLLAIISHKQIKQVCQELNIKIK